MELLFPGAVIRTERLKRNWSQEGLCRGICAVSYLSKIEKGTAAASPDILRLLFNKLEIPWYDDEETLNTAKDLTQRCYEAIFSNDEAQTESLSREFELIAHRIANSPYAMDAAVLHGFFSSPRTAADPSLERYFDSRQLALQRIMQGLSEEAMKLYPCAFACLVTGISNYQSGSNYAFALEALSSAYDLAAKEGRAHIMLAAKVYMGNCYSNQLDIDNMKAQYRIAERLAAALGSTDDLKTIKYNTASTEISVGQYDKAYQYFSSVESPEVMDLHKLAICCEKLERFDEAASALDRVEAMMAQTVPEYAELLSQMCFLVRCRIENRDYLKSRQYGKTLLAVFEKCREALPIGYAAFHLPWVLEWYTAARQYRAAYELTRDFPLKF